MKIVRAFFMCFGMFTAIPCPYRPWDEESREWMILCLPLVGAVIGGIWYLLSALGTLLLPQTLSAVLIAAVPFLLTGFMHLDGFMDTTDAVLSWRPVEERVKILKDVHCGSFAVVGLVLLMLGMFAAAQDALVKDLRALLFIPVVSRCLSTFCVSWLPPIGHSEYAGKERALTIPVLAIFFLLVTVAASLVWAGADCFLSVISVIIGYGAAMFFAFRSLKGVSGDLAGYSLCIGELCGLIALAVF